MPRPLAFLLIGALAFAACSGDDDDSADPEPEAGTNTTDAEPEAPEPEAVAVEAGTLVDRACADPPERVTCSFLEVPENRADPDAKTIRLAVAVVHSTSADPAPDPVVYLHGGPGGDAISGTANWLDDPVLETRDVVLFDQRGAGLSEPSLNCPEVDEDILAKFGRVASYEEERAAREAVWTACRERLVSEGIDLDRYHTPAHAADLESLRLALDVEQWNLFGVSYGTRLAMEYMRDYSEYTRTATLDSVVPPGTGGVSHLVTSAERGLQQLTDGCLADEACSSAYPDFATAIDRAYEQLNAEPYEGEVDLGGEAGLTSLAIDGYDARAGLFTALYDASLIPLLPGVVEAVAGGDYSFIPAVAQQGIPFATQFADGAAISVSCADNAIFAEDDADVVADPGNNAAIVGESTDAYCELWDVESVPERFHTPVDSDVPVFVLAGTYDPVTPPADSRSVAEMLANSAFGEWEAMGHGVLFSDGVCSEDLWLAFLDTTELPDVACAAAAPGPVFPAP